MKKLNWKTIYPVVLGFFALCWFIIRVIPKPSRASYPCQRAAFPIASAFVIWLASLITSAFLYVKFSKSLRENNWVYASIFIVLFGVSFVFYSSVVPSRSLIAGGFSDYEKVYWDGLERTDQLDNNIISTFDEVAVVKSTKENATDIEFEEIESMVRESIELAGGIDELISNGDYVVLKPNLVEMPPTPTPDYVEVSGIATDWRVVKAVAKIVRELNPDGKIYIIESSSATSTREVLNYYNYTLENIPEVDQIVALEDSCGAFEDYTDINLDKVFLADSVKLYPDESKPNLSPEFYINKIYNNADVVISIPVLKNHKLAIITGGVKNVAIGMTPPNIYGMTETFFGKWTKIDHGIENINKWLHDFYLVKPVDFVVVDGLQGFDHGPTGIEGLTMEEMQHNMRLIISGKKALSVDAVCGYIMSLDPAYANYMVYLDKEAYGVGTINSKFIRMNGESIIDIRKVFQHNTEVATNAIYTDYSPPVIEVTSTSIYDNIVTFTLDSDSDLNKVELKVNDVLLHQVCIKDFNSISFEISEDLIPIDSLTLIAYDRFFNKTQVMFDYSTIKEDKTLSFILNQNYPNPFAYSTNISFELSKSNNVKLYITDYNGRLIETLVNSELLEGNHQYIWNGNVPRGIYLLTIEIEGQLMTKQMVKK